MTAPWAGGSFGERARCLLAPNPGLMTLDGTNTWVLREPGASRCVVVDPGPVEEGHLERLDEELGDVGLVLVTHRHFDHSETAEELGRRKGKITVEFASIDVLERIVGLMAPSLATRRDQPEAPNEP